MLAYSHCTEAPEWRAPARVKGAFSTGNYRAATVLIRGSGAHRACGGEATGII